MKTDASIPRRFDNLQDFVTLLERRARLKRISQPVSLVYDVTEIHRRVLAEEGPALLFERPVDAEGRIQPIPLLANLFGTRERIEWGFGLEAGGLPHLAAFLADLRDPRPPRSLRDAWGKLPHLKAALSMNPRETRRAACQEIVWRGEGLDLGRLPIQSCWPGEPAPLVTWPLVITRAPDDPADINVGIYRMQKLGANRLIMRWLAHRGGARHHRLWQAQGRDMPVAVAIGADPATILSAVMPLPDGMSELAFAGVLGGRRQETASAMTVPLPVPANAEIVLEGMVSANEVADEGPMATTPAITMPSSLFRS